MADAVALEIAVQINAGTWGKAAAETGGAPTFEAYSEKWFDNYVCINCRESTQDAYTEILMHHVLPAFGERPIDSIKRADVRDFLIKKFKGGLSKTRTMSIKDVISSTLDYARVDGIIPANVASGIP